MLEGAKSIGAGAATIASAGAAVGIGNVFSSLIHSVARNPSLAKQLFGYAILGFALTEAIALKRFPVAINKTTITQSTRTKSFSPTNSGAGPSLPLYCLGVALKIRNLSCRQVATPNLA
ncbi:hypothetical protein JHK82_044112 [Glycine max]|nr:hypothetical protein JHK85_051148 [Glycine max]KAG4950670.1 hypothetical protein JHK86_043909 [Glycine max]KAG4979128.1 hypothetical protein JHK85_033086 [Glycine max]KAG4987242.1 hypothetical protein JHK86_034933 [Glycine max]KAG5070499.1 hypothetical protein JHK85_002876 [Glycine max]